jgi:hypothetical protein
MHFKSRRLVAAAVVVLAVVALGPVASAGGLTPGLPVHVGLGDSWAYGEGADVPATDGYFAVSHEQLRVELDCLPARSKRAADGCKHLQVSNVARPAVPALGLPGVTTSLVISEQLPVVVPLVIARNGDRNPRNDVEAIYLTVGGNDVSGPIFDACAGGLTGACVGAINSLMDEVEANYRVILGDLRDAAGADTPIVVTTYDNPIPFCDRNEIPGAAFLGEIALEGGADVGLPFIPRGLNDVIREVASGYGVDVADTWGQIGPGQWVGGSDCLHPNTTGHATIAAIATEAATR